MDEQINGIIKTATTYLIPPDLLDIDITMLDREWIQQPKIFFRLSLELINARREMERKKAKVDLAKAELDKRIRNDPANYGIDKITEVAVAHKILTRPMYKKALKKFNDSRYKVDVFQAIINALEHRRKGLERLVSLHGQNYFSEPRPLNERSKVIMNEELSSFGKYRKRKKKKVRKE